MAGEVLALLVLSAAASGLALVPLARSTLRKEPGRSALAASFGAFAAIVLVLVAYAALSWALGRAGRTGLGTFAFAVLVAPAVEEASKLLGVASLGPRPPARAASFGGFAGLGFAATENLVYAAVGSALGVADAGAVLAERAFGATALHVAASALAGYGLALLLERRPAGAAWIASAALLHAGFNAVVLAAPRLQAFGTAIPASVAIGAVLLVGLAAAGRAIAEGRHP